MNFPNIKHLHYLVLLHQHQHFHRAAEAASVSQSTLSSAILKLEELLGCQLLERDHKAFLFTSQGEAIVNMAREILLSTKELVDYAQDQGNPLSGSIQIGCIPTIAPFLLSDFSRRCQQQAPGLSLYLCENTTEKLLTMLANGDIDVAILALPIPHHGFSVKTLGRDHFYLAGNAQLVQMFQHQLDYRQMPANSVFLLTQEHCLSDHAVSACQLTDTRCVNQFSATSLSTLVQMTALHQGMTFLPEMAVNKGLGRQEGLTIVKAPGNVYREIGMLWRPTSMRAQTYRFLANIVEQLLA